MITRELEMRGLVTGGNFNNVFHVRAVGALAVDAMLAVLSVAVLSGCSGRDTAAPERTVTAFARAISASDGERACAFLSVEVSSTVAESTGMPCPAAVLRADLPDPSSVRSAELYGHQAFVTTGTDTLFLSEFPDGWKIIGAGCEPRGDKPYDCAISGG